MTKRRSKQDKFRQLNESLFIGREEPVKQFERHLNAKSADDSDFIDVLNIFGQGGVGKSYLSQKLMAMARAKNALTSYTDEGIKSVLELMNAAALQFKEQDAPLKKFAERYEKYLQEQKKLEADPDAPKGWVSFLAGTVVKGGLQLTKGIPIAEGLADMVDKDAAGAQASELADYLFKKWRNKDEVKLVLEPLEVLTPLWLDDLFDYEEKRHLCFFIDTYEETGFFLDAWLRQVLDGKYGDAPMNMTFVIAGRNKLSGNEWSKYSQLVRPVSLEPFSKEEALRYLAGRGITDAEVQETILQISHRLPVLLVMLADEAPVSSEDVLDVSDTAVDRFLKWTNDSVQRHLSLYAALPRRLNQDIIRLLIPADANAEELFYWLCDRPFVQKRGGYWVYHPVVRELMLQHLRRRSLQEWQDLHISKLAHYYDEQANGLGLDTRKEQYKDPEWLDYRLEYHYHNLLAAPKKAMPEVIRSLATVIRLNPFESAIPWSESICQAGQICGDMALGNLLREGLSHLISNDMKGALPFFSLINGKDWLIENDDAAFFWFAEGVFTPASQQQQTIDCYQKAIELKPDYADAYNNLGIALKAQNKLEAAIEQYQKAIELKPDDASAYNNLGNALKAQNKLEAAIEQYQKAIELKPDDASAYNNLGIALQAQNKLEAAIEQYQKAIELKPDDASAYNNLGIALQAQNKLEAAIEQYQKAIELKPDDASAYNNLGNALQAQNKLEAAIEQYQKAIELKPDDAGYWHALGWIYLIAGQLRESEIHFMKAGELSGHQMMTVPMNLGHVYLLLGDQRKAMTYYLDCLPLWNDKEDFFAGMESDYLDLKLSDRGIPQVVYERILSDLRGSL
jgi:Flp pilus assembly protein TadD